MRRIPLIPMVIFVNTDTFKFFPATGWMSAQDIDKVRDSLETLNMPAAAAMTITLGMEVANNPDAPDTPAGGLASSRTSDGMTFPVAYVDKSSTTNARQLVRFGYLAKNTTAADTTLRLAWVCGFVDAVKA